MALGRLMVVTRPCLFGRCRCPALSRGRVSATSRLAGLRLLLFGRCSAISLSRVSAISRRAWCLLPSILATSIWLLSGCLSGSCLFGSLYVASPPIVHRYAVRPPLGRHSVGCPALSRPCLAAIPRLALGWLSLGRLLARHLRLAVGRPSGRPGLIGMLSWPSSSQLLSRPSLGEHSGDTHILFPFSFLIFFS